MESSTIGKLAEALSKAQAEMEVAKKDSINPHFKSKYADIAAVIDAVREPLAKHGLSYVQYIDKAENGISLITKLMHLSGEWIAGALPLIVTKNDMQGFGSALTYARRYSLSAMVGIAQDDDDGNSANAKPDHRPRELPKPKWSFADPQRAELKRLMLAYAGGKEFINHYIKTSGELAHVTEDKYFELCNDLVKEAEKAKADPQSFDNFVTQQ